MKGAKISMQVTTSQGPSGNNQTSADHSLDSNQKARQPSTRDVMKAEAADLESAENYTDLSSARVR